MRVLRVALLWALTCAPVMAQPVPTYLPTSARLEIVHGPITISQPSNYDIPIVIENKILFPTAAGQTAIAIDWPRIGSSFLVSVILRNVVIAPGNGFHWRTGVDLTNGWLAQIDTLNCVGPGGVPNPLTLNCIVLRGQSTDVSINHLRCSGVWACLDILGESEGTRVSDFTILGGAFGITANTDGIEPGLSISHGHINVTHVAVWLRNRREWSIDDVLIYVGNYVDTTKTWPFYGVSLDNSPVGDLRNVRYSNISGPEKAIFPFAVTKSDRIRGDVERVTW